ncbi:hypothetical protein [Paraburkholderia atlantica]|uniref:hypothetical protein n=1 Tax=Paraburkholderia atlantica TaxID=2654982 RepID=UPI00161D7B2F|nr:hypothetical protein [Paraburkholderia atlantica]MBB5508829.1 hypothetical protein [Paraburkholderia atlantica]
MTRSLASRISRCAALHLVVSGLLSRCAMMTVNSQGPGEYIAMRHGDILSTGRLSAATPDTLQIAATYGNTCQREPLDCINPISTAGGIDTDWRLSSLAELSLRKTITNTPANASEWSDAQFDLSGYPKACANRAKSFRRRGCRSPGYVAFIDVMIWAPNSLR